LVFVSDALALMLDARYSTLQQVRYVSVLALIFRLFSFGLGLRLRGLGFDLRRPIFYSTTGPQCLGLGFDLSSRQYWSWSSSQTPWL